MVNLLQVTADRGCTRKFFKLTSFSTIGNGAAMRMGPLGAYYYNNEDALIISAIESALLTHRDPRGISAAVAMAIAAAYLCNSNGIIRLLSCYLNNCFCRR